MTNGTIEAFIKDKEAEYGVELDSNFDTTIECPIGSECDCFTDMKYAIEVQLQEQASEKNQ